MDIEIGGETFHKEPNLLEQIAYRDTWGRGAGSFLAMIYERLLLMRDLMHREGSIYVHCDWRLSGLLRVALDDVFSSNFQNEIIWLRTSGHSDSHRWNHSHDVIFFHSRSESPLFHPQYLAYKDAYVETGFGNVEEATGRKFSIGDLMAGGLRQGETGKPWRGINPADRKGHWQYPVGKLDELDREGKIYWPPKGKIPRLKRYLDEMPGMPAKSIWDDISLVQGNSAERVDYPTQKPEALLERVIKASSNEGDLVADFFAGSGTTAAVAEKLGRKWIATDLGKFGIHTTRKRLIQVQRELKAGRKPFRAFEVLNLGRYERQAYLNVTGRLSGKKKEQALARKEQEFRDLILRAYRAEPLPDAAFFHGRNGGRLVVVGPINLPVGRLFIEEVITECRKRGASRVDVLAFEFEMGLFPAGLEEAKQKGIDLAPKTIPPEVFDKRTVEKGQVRFHDVAYVEATPRYDPADKLSLSVQLTDFSVYYSQGLVDSITADLKAGKSEVVCEAGNLVKFTKDKEGILRRVVLTKQWTDWVDYWAVDFNYESRREIINVAKQMGVEGALPGVVSAGEEFLDFEERWTGAYIFENEWQSFRTRQNRELELTTAPHTYARAGRYVAAVKVIDIFGNDTMTLLPVSVG